MQKEPSARKRLHGRRESLRARLVQGANVNFSGTTTAEGAHQGRAVFEMTPAGALTTLFFCAQLKSRGGPNRFSGLTQIPNGTLYGTTTFGGAGQSGIVFQITLDRCSDDAAQFLPATRLRRRAESGVLLISGFNGKFFGTTYARGAGKFGTVFALSSE
jgi:uncharacterized repeat protein (TIGR03803 family)